MNADTPLASVGVAERRWGWFVAWAVPGACLGMCVSVIGLFTIPVGVLMMIALARRSGGREMLGLLMGVGIVATFIGSLHVKYQACSTAHISLVLRPGQTSVGYSCGGVDGIPWMIVGIAAIIAAAALYWHLTARPSSAGRSPASPTLG
ncbi:MAG: hypothetical protein ABSG64_00965 [Solirubrobacteraceae bacterium]|jgi:hypothetical protein